MLTRGGGQVTFRCSVRHGPSTDWLLGSAGRHDRLVRAVTEGPVEVT